MAFFIIRFGMQNILAVGEQSEVTWLYTASYIADMVHLVSCWDGSIVQFENYLTPKTCFSLQTDPGIAILIQSPSKE